MTPQFRIYRAFAEGKLTQSKIDDFTLTDQQQAFLVLGVHDLPKLKSKRLEKLEFRFNSLIRIFRNAIRSERIAEWLDGYEVELLGFVRDMAEYELSLQLSKAQTRWGDEISGLDDLKDAAEALIAASAKVRSETIETSETDKIKWVSVVEEHKSGAAKVVTTRTSSRKQETWIKEFETFDLAVVKAREFHSKL